MIFRIHATVIDLVTAERHSREPLLVAKVYFAITGKGVADTLGINGIPQYHGIPFDNCISRFAERTGSCSKSKSFGRLSIRGNQTGTGVFEENTNFVPLLTITGKFRTIANVFLVPKDLIGFFRKTETEGLFIPGVNVRVIAAIKSRNKTHIFAYLGHF